MPEPRPTPTLRTGIPELDVVLRGGLPRHRLHLVEGAPGAGKTTFALRFLLEGVACGERCLYVTLSETAEELTASAASHGWSLEGIDLFELVPAEAELESQQTVLYPAEAEFGETMRAITGRIEATRPERVVIDSLSELRLLAQDPLPYRRQLLGLKRFLQGRRVTTMVLDDLTGGRGDGDLHSLVHGVLSLEQIERDYGASRRRLRIAKMRGTDYQSGWHDFALVTGEVLVFPSLIAEEHKAPPAQGAVPSGLAGLDEVLGGGLDRGTTTILVGPSGVGKSSIALRYAMAAVGRGEHAAYFSFDETYETLARRAAALGLPLAEAVGTGELGWSRASPSRLSPGEFVWRVRREVEDRGARLVVIDSLNSYLGTMPEERSLVLQLHELLTYLNNQGVVTILILAQQGVVGDVQNPVDLSFLSDAVVLLRFFEAAGEVRKAISVVKKRTGVHGLSIREFRLFPHGMQVGPPLLELRGVLTGVPAYAGPHEPLLDPAGDEAG
ncbi:ATPase domain-containing protein [Roseomonas mucosa]|uniref:ATPase domain-containing protein n=1 Tax=Roseomonas mucosa TaxID=207340 RepID=UPI0028CF1214|nr:ATPase domain-containing protein [Roseomonas mucosa]MDT8315429.1 ATPase domain-containing protein [Roseomonas mucosa]MDT8361690.1 ATPase domain-containing protein [Roseomonas mucosa]